MDTLIKEKKELPKDWKWAKLGEVCEKVEAVKRKEKKPEEEFLYLDIGGIDNSANKILSHKNYKWKDAPSRAQQIVFKDDVLFSTVRTYMKNIALVENKIYNGQIASSGFCVLRSNKRVISPKFIFYYTVSQNFLRPLNELQTGSSYPAVRDKDVFIQPLPLPSLQTQQAIVSKIEELFSELDKGVENLLLSQQQLKTYRQSVLKWAFEGKYSMGVEKWKNMTMRQASLKIVVGYVGPVTQHIVLKDGIKFLSTTHIGENEFLNHDIREISKAFNESNRKSQVIPGDIIIARHGDSGKACIIPDWIKIAQVSNAVILRPNPEIALPLFICYRLNAERQRMQKMKVGGVFQVVNTKSMESFQTLIPPIDEQQKIIDEIESRLSVADKMEESITQSLQQAEALRQSILKKAFEGGLI